jgi:membrane-associated phospholipid phosphatase
MVRDEVSFLTLRVSESLAFIYFLYLAIVCWLRPLSRARRTQVAVVSAGMLVVVMLIANGASRAVRDWAPAFYILVGYFLPGRFFERPSTRFEAWLMDWDQRLLGDPTTRFASWPRPLVVYLDIVYMGCFLILPGGFLALALGGHADAADRYWTLVAGADFAAFLSLTVLQARPPWALERTPELASAAVHRAALVFVRRGTIGANTFPSGHTAVSFAVSYALLPVLPSVGLVSLFLSVTIGVACIVGRYHYVIDVVTGVLLSLAVLGAVSLVRF